MAVSLRLPEAVKRRIAKLASQRETTAHAFILEAIREKVELEEAEQAFHAQAERRLARMKKSGLGIPADEVFAYLKQRTQGEPAKRPKSRRLR